MKSTQTLIFAVFVLAMLSAAAFATTQHLINVQGKAANKTTGTLTSYGGVR